MGKHFWSGAILLFLLLALTLGIGLGATAIHEPARALLEQAADAALADDLPRAVDLARQARQRWERFRGLTAVVADHTPMDEADRLFGEMDVFATARDGVHFAACCSQLAQQLRSMSEAHSGSWWNLL